MMVDMLGLKELPNLKTFTNDDDPATICDSNFILTFLDIPDKEKKKFELLVQIVIEGPNTVSIVMAETINNDAQVLFNYLRNKTCKIVMNHLNKYGNVVLRSHYSLKIDSGKSMVSNVASSSFKTIAFSSEVLTVNHERLIERDIIEGYGQEENYCGGY